MSFPFQQRFGISVITQTYPSFTYIRRVRITSSGGEVGRLNTGGGAEVHSLLIMSPFNLSGIYFVTSFNYTSYGHKIR